jgi:transcription antitermination factor NusB
MSTRRKLREQILKMLYQREVGKSTSDEVFSFYLKEEKPDSKSAEFVKAIFFGTAEKIAELDQKIEKFADNWKLNRIALVDKNILRMALYEMLYCDDIPTVVSINEAVDIAKKYSTADSGKFVNGLLDKIKNELAQKRA